MVFIGIINLYIPSLSKVCTFYTHMYQIAKKQVIKVFVMSKSIILLRQVKFCLHRIYTVSCSRHSRYLSATYGQWIAHASSAFNQLEKCSQPNNQRRYVTQLNHFTSCRSTTGYYDSFSAYRKILEKEKL